MAHPDLPATRLHDVPAVPDAMTDERLVSRSVSAFKPTKRQQAYLTAWLDPQQPKTISAIARAIDVPRRTIADWLRRDAFVRWFDAEVTRETEHLWKPLLLKVTQLGMQGSVEHAKLLAQIRGAIRNEDAGARGGVTVVVGIPRAGELVPLPVEAPRPALSAAVSSSEH